MFGAVIVMLLLPVDSWWQAVVLVPGAPVGLLAQLAYAGGAWAPGLLGLPVVLPALVSLVVWPCCSGCWPGGASAGTRGSDPAAQRRVSIRWKLRCARDGVGPRCPW